MVDEPVPDSQQNQGTASNKENEAEPRQAVHENAVIEGRRAKAGRYASAAKEKLRAGYQRLKARWPSSVFWTAMATFWSAVATVAMAVTTIVYTHYAKKQWQEMQSSGAQSDQYDLLV
jgi:hypothetical protein